MEEIAPDRPRRHNEAKETAAWIGERIPLVWGSEGISAAAAWRWKCALNENAKAPAFAATFPELDHHEVVAWAEGGHPGFVVLALREEGEHPSLIRRLEATRAEVHELPWRQVEARGASPLSRVLSLMLLGDLTSTYLGLARGLDPGPIDSLSRIKERLREGPA
jgi:glucose/mannose-6-phosphate isomerase